MEEEMNELKIALLGAPCNFCGYNGKEYFLAGTHATTCPWYHVGGHEERIEHIIKAVKERRLHIYPNVIDVEEYYK